MSTVRVYGRVNVDKVRPGEWIDLADDDHLTDLLSMAFVTLVDDAGNGAPAVIPPRRCCT